eukprot:gene5923-23150_t
MLVADARGCWRRTGRAATVWALLLPPAAGRAVVLA